MTTLVHLPVVRYEHPTGKKSLEGRLDGARVNGAQLTFAEL